ncbi:MAG: hypothetical protein ACUVTL_03765 [Thermoproteota archaeon]
MRGKETSVPSGSNLFMKMLAMLLPLLILMASIILVSTTTSNKDEFETFKEFDTKENLIHIFAGEIFGLDSEREAVVEEGESITWGWEWFDVKKENIEDILEGSTTSLKVDGIEVLSGDCWSEIRFFPDGFDHDGDGFGDGDADGIGDIPQGFAVAFRFTKVLNQGLHRWIFYFTDRTGLVRLSDSGIIIVHPRQ